MVVLQKLRKGIFNVITTPLDKMVAKLQLQTAILLARDLQSERNGDQARFVRMVDGHGKQVVTHNLAVKNVWELSGKTVEYYPVTCRYLNMWMEANRFVV